MKVPVLGILGSILFALPNPAQADPLCYLKTSSGKTIDLTAICGASKSSPSTTLLTTSQPRTPNTKKLLYVDSEIETYADLGTVEVLNNSRRATLSRVFKIAQKDGMKMQELEASVDCPRSLKITQQKNLDQSGQLLTSATGGCN